MLLSSLLLLTSCDICTKNTFYFEIKNEDVNKKFTTKSNKVDLEIYESYYIYFYIPEDVFNAEKDKESLVDLQYDESKFEIKYYSYLKSNRSIYYSLKIKETFDSETLRISYKEDVYELNIKSLDYSFKNESKVEEQELVSRYKEYKDMVDSLTFHEYEEPYVGIDSYHSYSEDHEYTYSYNFSDEYDLEYLKYLKDDSYYPSKFDLAKPNVVFAEATMQFDDESYVEKNSPKGIMGNFNISLGIIDPGCTNPTNPLRSLIFSVTPLDYVSKSNRINKENEKALNSQYYLLSQKYQDKFSSYKINGLDIKMIRNGDNIEGFFKDSKYLYTLSCGYVF